jgi:hypothetical protein
MSNKFTKYQKQSHVIEGVSVGVADYDELLREAVRVALQMDMNPARDDWDDLYERTKKLISAYIASPEGEGEATCTLMARLAASVADVIPVAARKELVTWLGLGASLH